MIAKISAALIVLFLMAVPGESEAACAWVLWATAPDASFHTPIAGWEDQRACTSDMKKRNLEPEQPGQRQKRAVYFCLPDTVDPRGPKGGGR